jgi:hypothetical protein
MRGLLLAGTAFSLVARCAAGQTAPSRVTRYLFQSDVGDGRAVWINPAGTAVTPSASVYGDLTARGPGDTTRLAQVTAGLSSRGLSFGYQYDDFDGGEGHTYRLGLAGAAGALSLGAAAAYYRGDAKDWGYDIGAIYRLAPALTLGATVANIGEPVVRQVRQPLGFVPGATLKPFGPAFELSVQGRLAESDGAYAAGVRWRLPVSLPVAVRVRADTDGDLKRTGVVFGLVIGDRDQVGLIVTTPPDGSAIEATSVHGVAQRPMGSR